MTAAETIPAFWPCEQEALRPPEALAVSEWARQSIVLLPETSREPGPYNWRRTPYAKGVMDMYAHPDIRHMVLKWATQLGKTSVIYNILGYIIDQDPYPSMVMYPSDDECKLISRTRVQPMIEASPALRDRIPSEKGRYQLTEMHFPGMVLYLVSGNSVTGMAQRPVRNLLRDEVNKYPAGIGEHGDPMALSEERLKGFFDIRKVLDVSSPTTEQGNISIQERACQVVLGYYVPCPHCGRLQLLEWEQIKFEDNHELDKVDRIANAKATAAYECRHCSAVITDQDKDWMLAIENGAGWYQIPEQDPDKPEKHGAWSPDPSDDSIGDLFREFASRGVLLERVAFRLGSIYSPWISFGDVAEAFLAAHLADVERYDKLRSFTNNWLAREWADLVEEKSQSEILRLRCKLFPLIVPAEAVALTAGIDMQKHGFYFSVWAWARDVTGWMIHYGELATWDDILNLVYGSAYRVEDSERTVKIWRAGIDTGGTDSEDLEDGSMTAQAYRWLAQYGGNTVFGLKGSSRELPGKVKMSMVGTIPGTKKIIPGAGIRLWNIDTGYFKDLFSASLATKHGDPGCVYLHKDTGDDFARQLASEAKRRNKQGRYRWMRVRGQNHYLDTSIYARSVIDPMFLGGLQIVAQAHKAAAQRAPRPEATPGGEQRPARIPDSRITRPAAKRAMW